MEENPFKDLKISSSDPLDQVKGRVKCTKCDRSRKNYCYLCGIRLPGTEDKIPTVKLPVKLDIIRHPVEETGKNTAVHACILAPDDVTMYTWPDFPDYEDKSKLIVVFPSKDSVTLAELVHGLIDQKDTVGSENLSCDSQQTNHELDNDSTTKCNNKKDEQELSMSLDLQSSSSKEDADNSISGNVKLDSSCSVSKLSNTDESLSKVTPSVGVETNCDISSSLKRGFSDDGEAPKPKTLKKGMTTPPFERVIFVDSTWHYANRVGNDERLKGAKHVVLRTQTTKFWRYQHKKPDSYLATIEAIYYFFCEYHGIFSEEVYDGRYDDLLFLFVQMYDRVRLETGGGGRLKVVKAKKEVKSK